MFEGNVRCMITRSNKSHILRLCIFGLVWILLLNFSSCDQGKSEIKISEKSGLKIIESEGAFNQVVDLSKEKLLVMEFYADWCGPCHALEPILKKIQKEHSGQVEVYKILYDKNRKLIRQFQVDRIPYVLFIRDNIIVYKMAGLHPEKSYLDVIKGYQHKPL